MSEPKTSLKPITKQAIKKRKEWRARYASEVKELLSWPVGSPGRDELIKQMQSSHKWIGYWFSDKAPLVENKISAAAVHNARRAA